MSVSVRVLSVLFIGIGLLSCSQQQPEPGELRVALAQSVMSLDPRFSTDAASHRVQELVHRGLVRLDEHFEAVPDAADAWTHPDALIWKFHLRSDLYFHDGRAVHAADVAATLNSILNPATASPLRAGFSAIERVEVNGERDVTIHLSHPDASLLTRLSIGILPADVAKKGNQVRAIIGCGACRVVSGNDRDLVLERVGKLPPHAVRRFHFITVKDPVTRCLKLARGEVDFTENDLPPHLLGYLKKQENLHISTRPSTTFSYIGMNLHDKYLADVRVRHALALALNRATLKKALNADLPQLGETVLTPSHWAAKPLPATAFDVEKANALLDAAGFKRGADGIRFQLNYRTSTDPARLRMASAIAAVWRKIGVHTHVE